MSSVADVNEGAGGSSNAGEPLGALGAMRASCVATEIPVNATGTRPGSGPDKRELFSEDAVTVLVFPDGAVIRLSAAVATGQLIFLTNKQTNIEVVSQVVGKRVYKPTSCYVELKFTEDIAGFWGVEFPAKAAEKPHTRTQPKTETEPGEKAATDSETTGAVAERSMAEQVESAETTEDSGTPVAALPTGKEVEELRGEVEALRRQLEEMKRAEAAARAVANMAAPAEIAPVSQDRVAPVVKKRQETLASVNEQTPVAPTPGVTAAAPVTAAPVEARTSHVPMSLPNRTPAKVDPEQEVIDQLLPRPELDFSNAPIPPKRGDWDDPYGIYKPARAKIGKQVLALLVLVLIGVAGAGALKLGLLGRITSSAKMANSTEGQAKKSAVVAKTEEIPKPTSAPNAGIVAGGTSPATNVPVTPTTATNANSGAGAETAPVKPETNSAQAGKPKANGEGAVTATDASNKVKVAATAAAPVSSANRENGSSKNKVSTSAKKKVSAKETGEAAPAEAAAVAEDAPVVPAKLLRSVNPVYPPDAMRNFITGDVKLKAEVDEKGQIRNVEVLSGPKALRQAAIEAFRQYEYEPATKGGKGEASQVRVTIKFWFVP